jgi:hypothetical protein
VHFYYQGAITEAARYLDLNSRHDAGRRQRVPQRARGFFPLPRQTFLVLRRTDLPIRWFDRRDSFVIPAADVPGYCFPPWRPIRPRSIARFCRG